MAKDYSENDELNEFIAVELAMGTGRIMTRVHDRVYIALEVNKIIARIVEKIVKMETEKARSGNKKSSFSVVIDDKEKVLNRYWQGSTESEIAKVLGVDTNIVSRVLDNWIPRDLIYKKYNSGMLPSRIGRLAAINLSTNCVRRVLNMPPVKEK